MAVRPGLSTTDALQRLTADVDDVLRKHCGKSRSRWRSLRLSLKDSVTWNYRSLIYVAVLLVFLLLAIAFEGRALDIFMFLFIVAFSVLNTVLVCKIRWKRWILWRQKVEEIRALIDDLSQSGAWCPESSYPSLYQPTTPSVHLQWTYRDGQLVNLPACLLVRGDLVLLRPGQEIFAECRSVDEEDAPEPRAAGTEERYSPGQVFRPAVEPTSPPGNVSVPTQHNVQLPRTFGNLQSQFCFSHAQGRPIRRRFEVTKTPFVDSLELMLVRAAEDQTSPWRSIPELSLAKGVWLAHLASAALLGLGLVEALALRLARPQGAGSLAEVFLRPVYVAYCLHPLLLPPVWTLVRAWLASQFRLFTDSSCMSATGSRSSLADAAAELGRRADEGSSSVGGSDRMTLLGPTPRPPDASLRRQLRELGRLLRAWDAGASELVFSLGTLTALCCVDKKGVLSLPQPTIDKVFFLRRRHHRHGSLLTSCPTSGSLRRTRRRSEVSMGSAARREDNYSTIGSQGSARGPIWRSRNNFVNSGEMTHQSTALHQVADFHSHILELGNNPLRPYEQVFEDRHWQRYLNSLKPIGLNILLNNCNAAMFPRYTTFADYLTLLADRSPVGREVAAINHRCMCGLARQIGFVRSATQPFQLATSLAAFRHSGLPAQDGGPGFQSSLQERLFRALSSCHHRTPMAHVLSAVTSQARVGCLQLMSQGSADLLLDLCVDYWDGHDLSPLREAEKRRALDFYHRHIHSAYCTAFAYSPLFESIAEPMTDVVLELPQQSVSRAAAEMGPRLLLPSRHHLPGVQTVGEMETPAGAPAGAGQGASGEEEAPGAGAEGRPGKPVAEIDRTSPFRSSADTATRIRSMLNNEVGMSSAGMAGLHRSMSAESMMSRLSAESISTSEDCMELLKNQVFLGMASLQYQPLADVVPLVSHLQEACVRFVHFSQENELRSRVFAEKLGLEAGSFNCHISLAESDPLPHPQGTSGSETPGAATLVHRSSQQGMQDSGAAGTGISRWDSAPVVLGNAAFFYQTTVTDDDLERDDSDDKLEISFGPTGGDGGGVGGGSGASHSDPTPCSSSTNTSTSEVDSLTHHLRQDKSQMPRGIAAIRPHLKNVDNIPLQVSLFTDCSADAVREMLEIMQENGEIVGVVGSTLSLHNTAIFLQADCSLGLQPDTPYVCVGCDGDEHRRRPSGGLDATPIELAGRMLALACCLAGRRDTGLRFLLPSMADCRALVQRVRLALVFHFCCGGFLSAMQLLAVLVGWPDAGPGGATAHDFFLFDGSCLLWLQLVACPLLSLPVLLCHTDQAAVMKKPPTKRDAQWVHKRLKRQLLFATARCLPSLVVCLVLAHLSVMTTCGLPEVACALDVSNLTNTNATVIFRSGEMQRSAGQFIFLFAICYLSIISLSYINMGKRLLQANHRSLFIWALFSGIHILVTFLAIVPMNLRTFGFVHPMVWAAAVMWMLVLLVLNDIINYKENSINLREERRIRFMFNTKLGMYSPV